MSIDKKSTFEYKYAKQETAKRSITVPRISDYIREAEKISMLSARSLLHETSRAQLPEVLDLKPEETTDATLFSMINLFTQQSVKFLTFQDDRITQLEVKTECMAGLLRSILKKGSNYNLSDEQVAEFTEHLERMDAGLKKLREERERARKQV
jgi:DNA-directed RNA polymerase subunit F